ncbi:MAG TPA: GerAB/ArcD/ProY family transporter [Clostridiales bacterium]|nr:GerAB/ArcD/ProY family transporter [Clostridiales bacterium]
MNKELSLRQISYIYVFISLSSIVRQIPSALAAEAGRSAYISPLWSIVAIVPLTFIVVGLIKLFPGLNLYEIMLQVFGTLLTKIMILAYLLWFILLLATEINIYTQTLQFTLMPQTRNNFFLITLIFLVAHVLQRGLKTVFRFSEFTLGIILFAFIIIFLCSINKIREDYLLPVSTFYLVDTARAAVNVVAVGGNIIIALFFSDKLGISTTKMQRGRLWISVGIFLFLTFFTTLSTIGINGASLTAILPFPFYNTVKGISFFDIFERFEVVVTLISMLSDFIAICILFIIIIRCFEWLFNLKEKGLLYGPLIIIVFYLTYYISSTQFEFEFLYRNVIIYLNIVFQYFIPMLIVLFSLFQINKIKKQY